MKKYISVIILIIIAITMMCQIVYAEDEYYNVKAKIIQNYGIEETNPNEEITKKVQKVIIRILEGEYENEEFEMTYIITEEAENLIANIELEEDDIVLINIQEKDGEITNIIYKETIKSNYILYSVGVILIILLIIIAVNTKTIPVILYITTIILVSFICIFSMKMGWNLILVSAILSFVITVISIIKVNGINNKTLFIILGVAISIAFAGLLTSILFDVMGFTNINIKITETFVNIKQLICSSIILVSCVICNLITMIKLNIDSFMNRKYKTKSDNIIEGQRSLKL